MLIQLCWSKRWFYIATIKEENRWIIRRGTECVGFFESPYTFYKESKRQCRKRKRVLLIEIDWVKLEGMIKKRTLFSWFQHCYCPDR